MNIRPVLFAGSTGASRYAASYLRALGVPITEDIQQDARHLLLDVPSFGPEGQLRGGGDIRSVLPENGDLIVYGGNLTHPSLDGYETVDFLQDPFYLAHNAYITAECALDVALPCLGRTLRNCPVLIIGWGRIGKCLGMLLKNIGARITVAARKPEDRAMLQALGYASAAPEQLGDLLPRFQLIFNTVPCRILPSEVWDCCNNSCVRIDLASSQGIFGQDVIIARGLPGIHMPESSGRLIAETFIRLWKKEE